MISYSIYNFAIKNKCKFLYVVPRTLELRKTFMKYGFEHIFGNEGIDEVLELEIEDDVLEIIKRGKTQKVKKQTNVYADYNDTSIGV